MRPLLVLSLASWVLLAACAPVRPWQRATHSDRRMLARPCAGTGVLEEHVLSVREGGVRVAGAGGSGCGCD